MKPAKFLKIMILISILVLWICVSFAEEEIEGNLSNLKGKELLQSYKTLASHLRDESPKQSLEYTNKILSLLTIQNLRFKRQTLLQYLIFAHYNRGWCLRQNGQYLKSVENFYRAYLQSSDMQQKFSILYQIGVSYEMAGFNEEAISYYQQAIDIEEGNLDNKHYHQLLRNMIGLLKNVGELERSIKIYDKLWEWEKNNRSNDSYNNKEKVKRLIDQGKLNETKSDKQQARIHYEEALILASSLEEKSDIYQLLGNLYEDEDFQKALNFYRKSLTEKSKCNNKYEYAELLGKIISIALGNWELSDQKEIDELINIAYKISEELHEYKLLTECCRMKSEYYRLNNDLKNSYRYRREYYSWQDSLRGVTEEIELKKKKDLISHKGLLGQFELTSKEIVQRELQLTKTKSLTNILIVLMLMLGAVWLLFYISYRNRKNYMHKLKEVNRQISKMTEQLKQRINEMEEFKKTLKSKYKDALSEAKWKNNLLIIQSRYVALSDMIENISILWETNLEKIENNVERMIGLYHSESITENILKEIVHESMDILQDMSNKIDDFRDFFRQHKNKVNFRVADVIRKVKEFVKDYYKNFRIEIALNEVKEVYIKGGYPNEFALVILNVFNNSREAFEITGISNPQITVTIDESYDRKTIEISDNAGGIPQSMLSKVFDPFFSTREERNACGLGLYIVRELIEKKYLGKVSIANQHGGISVRITI